MSPLKLRTTKYDFQEACEWLLEDTNWEEKELITLMILLAACKHAHMTMNQMAEMLMREGGITQVDMDWPTRGLANRLGRHGKMRPEGGTDGEE